MQITARHFEMFNQVYTMLPLYIPHGTSYLAKPSPHLFIMRSICKFYRSSVKLVGG